MFYPMVTEEAELAY